MSKKKPIKKQGTPPVAAKEPARAKKKTSAYKPFFLDGKLEQYGLPVVCIILFIMLVVLFNQYIFFDKLMLYKDIGSDTVNYYWPAYYHYSKVLHTFHLPLWTFAWGMGQNDFPADLGDVPGWLLYTVSPGNITYMFVYTEMLKIFLAGLFFFLFLRKLGLSAYISIIGAALYCFSGFMTVGAAWYAFTTHGCYVALMLLGVELLRQNKNMFVFPIAVVLMSSYNAVYFYLATLLVLAYLIFFFLLNGFQRSSINFLVRLLLLGVLGMGISALFLFGNIYQMLESPRGSGTVSMFSKLSSRSLFYMEDGTFYGTFFKRFLGNDAAGYVNSFVGWKNFLEAPAQYCGLLSLLLLPQLFALASKRLKWLAGAALGIAIIPVIFPYFRYAFWLFTGDYFRTYSLFFIIVQVLLALKAFDLIIKQRKLNLPLLVATVVILSLFVFMNSTINPHIKAPVFIFLLIESLLLIAFAYTDFYQAALLLLPLITFIEIVTLSSGTFNSRSTITKPELTQKIGYNDYIVDVVKYLHDKDKEFYRVHKDIPSGVSSNSSLNDGMMQDYSSSSSYSAFNQKNYVNFLLQMKIISDSTETGTKWIVPFSDFPLMQLFSGKYLLTHSRFGGIYYFGWDSVTNVNGITVWRTKFFVPLGCTYNSFVRESEMAKIPHNDKGKDLMMLKAVVINDSLIKKGFADMHEYTSKDTLDNSPTRVRINDSTYTSWLKEDTLQIKSFSDNHISGNINTSSKKLLFFSIPFDNGWSAVIDGKKVKPMMVNFGFLGFMLQKGTHTVELNFEPVYYEAGVSISLVSLLLFAGLGVVTFVMRRRKRNNASLPRN